MKVKVREMRERETFDIKDIFSVSESA